MNFKIRKLILWPKNTQKGKRIIEFELDKINIITGGSERGKSAIISIMDYCLGSNECRIPTRLIRDLTAWFGLLIETDNETQVLLIRREPGENKVSGDMIIREGKGLIIPDEMNENNIVNYQQVKHRLNNLAGLPYIDFSEEEESKGFDSRPSFRDMVSMVFQPQYIIANQSSLFYKADSARHRRKLTTIFPYILGAVDNEYLELKEELKEKEAELNLLENQLERRKRSVDRWLGEIRSNYVRALEFGLLDNAPYPEEDWKPNAFVGYLRQVKKKVDNNEIPFVREGVTARVTDRLVELEKRESEIAHEIQSLRNRREVVKRLENTNREYREVLLGQYGRLKGVEWFNEKIQEGGACPMCGSDNEQAKKHLSRLVEVNSEVISKGVRINDNYTVLSSEVNRLNKVLREKETHINSIRKEIEGLRDSDKDVERRVQTINAIYQFAGKIEAEINNYDSQLDDSGLLQQIRDIDKRITEIEGSINEEVVNNKLKRANKTITGRIKHYAGLFKAENHDEYIEFNHKDLTLNFLSKSGRWDALYQIGSGSNYMAYHISTMLALHEFFLKDKKHPVPNFLVLDQPTQVYFPETDKEIIENSEDVQRVRRIFEALAESITKTKNGIQIIVLEHAGEYAWKGFKHMKRIKRWRPGEEDDALIPSSWLS